MDSKNKDSVRLTINLPKEIVDKLDEIGNQMLSSSATETVRRIIVLTSCILEALKEGYNIQKDIGEGKKETLKFPTIIPKID